MQEIGAKYEALIGVKEDELSEAKAALESKHPELAHEHPQHTSTHPEYAKFKHLTDELYQLDDVRDQIQGFTVYINMELEGYMATFDEVKDAAVIHNTICKASTMKGRYILGRYDLIMRKSLRDRKIPINVTDRDTIQVDAVTIVQKFQKEIHLNAEHGKIAETKEHDIYKRHLADLKTSMKNLIIAGRDGLIEEVELVKQNHVQTPYLDEAVIAMNQAIKEIIHEVEKDIPNENEWHAELNLLANHHDPKKERKSMSMVEFIHKATESIKEEIARYNSFGTMAAAELSVVDFEIHDLKSD